MSSRDASHIPDGCRVLVLPEERTQDHFEMFASLPEVMTCKQASEALSIHPKTLRELANAGSIKGFRVGKVWRFSRRSLVDFIEGGGHV